MPALERMSECEVRYPYLSPSELEDRLRAKAVLYLPVGSLEWHNEHLPLGTDTFHAIELASRLACSLGGVVLPGFWWNTGGCHDHAVTYHMPECYYRAALRMVIMGLRPIPAKLLVIVNGHGGGYQAQTPELLAEELNHEGFPMRVVAADPYGLGKSSPLRIDHADTGETSFAMALIPQLVRMDRPYGPDIYSGAMPFAERGMPSAEQGELLWKAYFADAQALLERIYPEL
jgi:creatinine amidohydrolase